MKILIAVDESECARDAVDSVAQGQWKNDDEFMLLNVVETIPIEFGMGVYIDDRGYSNANDIVANLRLVLKDGLPNNKIAARVLTGQVVDQVCSCAREWDADLIVLGSHGRKGFQHFMLGSVAEEILKAAPCSVKVIKHRKHFQDPDNIQPVTQLASL